MNSSSQPGLRSEIQLTYSDPLDLVWLHCASELGVRVERDDTVFASWDGKGTLRLGAPASLDADDCLAQMILHELCHALVEGPTAMQSADWGLQIDNPEQRYREHACLRLQAALTRAHGLRHFLAATTSFRTYYDALPEDPLEEGEDPAVGPARHGWLRATEGPWSQPLQTALISTAAMAAIIRPIATSDSLWDQTDRSE